MSPNPHGRLLQEAETGSRLTNGSCAVSLNSNQVVLSCGRVMNLIDLSPADFRRFLTVLADRRLLGSQYFLSTGLVANGIRLTKRCNVLVVTIRYYPWSAGSWQVFHIVGFSVFSDYSIVVAHLTSNSFEDLPVLCMPIICHLCDSDIRLRTMLTENE